MPIIAFQIYIFLLTFTHIYNSNQCFNDITYVKTVLTVQVLIINLNSLELIINC